LSIKADVPLLAELRATMKQAAEDMPASLSFVIENKRDARPPGPALNLHTRSVDICTGARADIN
jgi:hypothetical protein